MRWMWIDTIIDCEPEQQLVAIKNVSLAELHLHDHFPAQGDLSAYPVMPASLIIEGMAQAAGILVGSTRNFKEKVILAKIISAELLDDVVPGQTIRYTANLQRIDQTGASTAGVVQLLDHRDGAWRDLGRIDLMFSHLDQNRAGIEFPEENFVFGENFRTILANSGILERLCTTTSE